jgi:hypothetical protein
MKIITGMHRSGTSLVARLFYEAGADMGGSNFYRPDKWNLDGYFEKTDFHSVNMPLINGHCGKLAYFSLPSTTTILKRAIKISDKIKDLSTKYHGKVVKETRFCLTLPAWIKYGHEIEKIIICLRDPIQVAYSIKKRNHFSLSHALSLWHEHNFRILENAKNIPQWFVYYKNLLSEESSLKEIQGTLNFFGIDLNHEKILELKQKCVKPDYNHNKMETTIYPRKINDLWQRLLKMHKIQFIKKI